jgi:hypothetical protein
MSRKSKLLAAIKNNPKNIDFADIRKLLEDVGLYLFWQRL